MSDQAVIAAARAEREKEKEMESLDLTEDEYTQYLYNRSDISPELYDINLMLDDYIVGEEFNRMSTFCIHILANGCVYVSGDSGAGKTQLMDAVAQTVLPGKYLLIEGCSDKVIYDKKVDIEKCSHIAFPELNKITNNPLMIEAMKSWGEGKPVKYERSVRGQYSQKIELPRRPFIFSRATESAKTDSVPGELYTRVVEFTVDSSKNQTRAVNSRVAEDSESPFDIKWVDKVNAACLRYYVSNLPEFNFYINPAAGKLVDYIPATFAASRRDYKKYLQGAAGICRFYHTDRIKFDYNGKSCLVVTPQDVFLNHLIFGSTLVRSAMRCCEVKKLMIKLIAPLQGTGATSQMVHTGLRQNNINTTLTNVKTHLDELEEIGYLQMEKEGSTKFYSVTDFYSEFEVQPDFESIIEYMKDSIMNNPHYTEWADDYVERFCHPDVTAIDPLTGEEIVITDFQFEEINNASVDPEKTRMEPRKQQQGLGAFM